MKIICIHTVTQLAFEGTQTTMVWATFIKNFLLLLPGKNLMHKIF